jgi:hypothetical protein
MDNDLAGGDTVKLLVPFASASSFAPAGTICTVRTDLGDYISVVGPDRHIWLAKPGEIQKVSRMDEVQGSIFAGVLEATDTAASEIAKLEAKQRANWIAYIFEALETELTETEMHSLLVESVLDLEQRLQAGR